MKKNIVSIILIFSFLLPLFTITEDVQAATTVEKTWDFLPRLELGPGQVASIEMKASTGTAITAYSPNSKRMGYNDRELHMSDLAFSYEGTRGINFIKITFWYKNLIGEKKVISSVIPAWQYYAATCEFPNMLIEEGATSIGFDIQNIQASKVVVYKYEDRLTLNGYFYSWYPALITEESAETLKQAAYAKAAKEASERAEQAAREGSQNASEKQELV